MPIEVKKHGVLYKEPKQVIDYKRARYRHTCKKCGCEFTFGWFDLEYVGHQRSPNDPFKLDEYRSIDCPECKSKCVFRNLDEEEPYELIKEE